MTNTKWDKRNITISKIITSQNYKSLLEIFYLNNSVSVEELSDDSYPVEIWGNYQTDCFETNTLLPLLFTTKFSYSRASPKIILNSFQLF